MEVSASLVKTLRARTGAGVMDCKQALLETEGDLEKATRYLREKGLAAVAKRAERVASEGLVEAYIHGGGRLGVLIEVNCETDFVARTPEFKALCRDLAMQVAASRPEYISREEVPPEVLAREEEIFRAQALNEGKPEKVIDRIVVGRIEKFYTEVCLLEQPFIKDPNCSVAGLINEKIAYFGENIRVRRFACFRLGEGA